VNVCRLMGLIQLAGTSTRPAAWMGNAPSSADEERRGPSAEEQAQIDELVAYVRQLPAIGSSQLRSSGAAASDVPLSAAAARSASACWSRAPARAPACAIPVQAGYSANVSSGLPNAAIASQPAAAVRRAGEPAAAAAAASSQNPCSAPIPIVRLSEWSSHDIDLASRDLDLAASNPFASDSMASLVFAGPQEVMPPSGLLLDPHRPATGVPRAHTAVPAGPSPPRLASGARAVHVQPRSSSWGFSRSLPSGSTLLRRQLVAPPPAPRCKPSPAPYSMPPKLELPPPSPATTSLSSSPLSSSGGVSLISSTPPESRFVQVGFQVPGAAASWTDREASPASRGARFASRARSR